MGTHHRSGLQVGVIVLLKKDKHGVRELDEHIPINRVKDFG